MSRAEVIEIIMKSLEEATDYELVEAYAQLVSCSDCPKWHDCKNEHECDVYMIEQIYIGRNNDEPNKTEIPRN